MTVLERKDILKRQIDLSDENMLEKIEKLIQSEKMVLPAFIMEDLKIAKKQIDVGEFLSEAEAENDFEQWLNEE